MTKYNRFSALIFLLTLTIFFSGCVKKEFDKPPVGTLPVGTVYTISQLRQMYADSGAIMINYDASVYAVVTMDESSGNIYKSAYIEDADDAVNLHKTSAGGLRIGDSVRVYLKKVVLSEYGGMFQLDNVNPDSNIVILGNQHYKKPQLVTIADLNTGNYQGKLIKLENVEFSQADLGKPYADPNASANRTLQDCDGNSVIVRTSNYATFAGVIVPDGKGELTAISGVFNGTIQLAIRSISEVDLKGERCDGGGGGGEITPVEKVDEHFDGTTDYEDVNLEGWTNKIVAGSRAWQGKTYNDNKYAQATGHNSGLPDMETWLITPPVINTAGDMKLSFKSAMAYWSHQDGDTPLTVWASTNYDGTNFESANWVDITNKVNVPTASSGENNWLQTDTVSLSDFTGNVAIAFKYKGSDSESTSIRIDDVLISTDGGGGGGGGGGDVLPSLNETFDAYADYDPIEQGGWKDIMVTGDRAWIAKTYSDNKYAQATGHNSGLPDMETWLITPPVINTAGDMKLSFKSAMAYWSHQAGNKPLTVLASTDYDGTNFETATWTDISDKVNIPDASSGENNWIETTEVSLSDFTGNVCIAFKYKGSDTESTSIRIDDVLISGDGGGGGGDVLPSLNETFDAYADYDPIEQGGWKDIMVAGDRAWIAKTYSDNKYAQATGHNSELDDMETWMITPLVDNSAGDKTLTFKAEKAYWKHNSYDPLEVYVSTDFNGDNFESATWTKLSPVLPVASDGDYEWIESGNVDLSAYTGNVAVAFKYKGSNTESTSIQVDDVVIE